MVRVEIWPGGDVRRRQEIAKIGIANVTDLADLSSYVVVRADDHGVADAVAVRGHRRASGPLPLISRACSPRASTKLTTKERQIVELIVARAF